MPHSAALPFHLRRSRDVLSSTAITTTITTTTETVHGLLRLEGDRLVVQWRLARKTERIGTEIRTDQEFEEVREVVIPLQGIAGAVVRRRWWEWPFGPKLVLTATDLQGFEEIAGEEGLRLAHPAQLVLRIRSADGLLAEEFSAELTLAVAELSLAAGQGPPPLPPGPDAGPQGRE